MKHRTRAWIDNQLSASEEKASCYVPHTKKEQKRLRRAMQEGYVVEVAPTLFARASYWSSLRSMSRMRHKILGLQELHPNWVFAGPSAGVAWGLAVSNRYLDKVWVATTRRAHGKELAFRRDVIVSHDEGEINAGVRLTSFARTCGRLPANHGLPFWSCTSRFGPSGLPQDCRRADGYARAGLSTHARAQANARDDVAGGCAGGEWR